MTNVSRLNPETLPDAGAMGYTQITIAEGSKLISLSGQVAWTRDGAPVPSSLAEQAALATDNVRKALAAAGAAPEHVTSLRLYIVDLTPERGSEAVSPLRTLFGDQAPCITVLGVTALATPELQVEIEAQAML